LVLITGDDHIDLMRRKTADAAYKRVHNIPPPRLS